MIVWENTQFYILHSYQIFSILLYGTGFLIFYCNVEFIATRCLAMCLGLPRFTGPTNTTQLESYWVHTSDEIMICKRSKKDRAKGNKTLKYCLRGEKRKFQKLLRTELNVLKKMFMCEQIPVATRTHCTYICKALFWGPGRRTDGVSDEVHISPTCRNLLQSYLSQLICMKLDFKFIFIFMLDSPWQMVFHKSLCSVNHVEQLTFRAQ